MDRVPKEKEAKPELEISQCRFCDLLVDAILFLDDSNKHAFDHSLRARDARASFVMAVCAMEAAINSVLDLVPLSKELIKRVERMSLFEKAELAARLNWSINYNANSKAALDAKELVDLRNSLVHPKRVRRTLQLNESNSSWEESSSQRKASARLKINHDLYGWTVAEAITALDVVDAFLSDYFIDVCRLSQRDLQQLLFNLIIDGNSSETWLYLEEWKEVFIRARDLGVQMRYLDCLLDSPPEPKHST